MWLIPTDNLFASGFTVRIIVSFRFGGRYGVTYISRDMHDHRIMALGNRMLVFYFYFSIFLGGISSIYFFDHYSLFPKTVRSVKMASSQVQVPQAVPIFM
jgi:hypothetical protein